MTALTASFEVKQHASIGSRRTTTCKPGATTRTVAKNLAPLTDEELIARARRNPEEQERCMDELFTRVGPKVATWCLRMCNDREEAADLAQEVVLRAYQRLDSFRLQSRFTTWLYSMMRRMAIDRCLAARRRENVIVAPIVVEPEDRGEVVDETITRQQVLVFLRDVMARQLAPLEAEVVYLHYVDGMTLPAITELLALQNKSGAKAYLVGGMRKLRRHFGPWLKRQLDAGLTP
jgi:RNA polymerase sigma-70 factor (ECF subfamily)